MTSEKDRDAQDERVQPRQGIVARFRNPKREPLEASNTAPKLQIRSKVSLNRRAGNIRTSKFIVLANEKGGTGKSTIAMHLAIGLLEEGHSVGCLDLDGRQATLSHFLDNREESVAAATQKLRKPCFARVVSSQARNLERVEQEEIAALTKALRELENPEYIVVDTPGAHCHLGRLALKMAHTLITPLNDSFLDIDILALIDKERRQVLEPSPYCKMVQEERQRRQENGLRSFDWIVLRNRLSQLDSHNTRDMAGLLDQLGQRMAFRVVPGLSERVVFRDLFFKGLTLSDLTQAGLRERDKSSFQRAQREIQDLIVEVDLSGAERRAVTTTGANN